jgi:hypothetical protein
MAYPATFDPDKLEVHVTPASAGGGSARQWKWMVCEKSKGPIESGIETGSRQKAVDAGNMALTNLIAKSLKQ